MNKLYVGNLSWGVTEDQLKSHFNQAGKVVMATIVLHRDTGRSRGFGFVEMSRPDAAEIAIKTLNNTYLGGRQILIREARPEGDNSDSFYKTISDFVNFKARPGDQFGFSAGEKHFTIQRDL